MDQSRQPVPASDPLVIHIVNGRGRLSTPTIAALAMAGAASVLLLGLWVEADQIGRTSTVRIFLVAAIALIAVAAAAPPATRRYRAAIGGAVGMLVTTVVLTLGDRATQGLVVMLIAIASLMVALRVQGHEAS